MLLNTYFLAAVLPRAVFSGPIVPTSINERAQQIPPPPSIHNPYHQHSASASRAIVLQSRSVPVNSHTRSVSLTPLVRNGAHTLTPFKANGLLSYDDLIIIHTRSRIITLRLPRAQLCCSVPVNSHTRSVSLTPLVRNNTHALSRTQSICVCLAHN